VTVRAKRASLVAASSIVCCKQGASLLQQPNVHVRLQA
jgi:hypothetical protein